MRFLAGANLLVQEETLRLYGRDLTSTPLLNIDDSNKIPFTLHLAIRQKCADSEYVDVFQEELPLGCQSADQDPFLSGSDGTTLG
jgi:hypothetical protein